MSNFEIRNYLLAVRTASISDFMYSLHMKTSSEVGHFVSFWGVAAFCSDVKMADRVVLGKSIAFTVNPRWWSRRIKNLLTKVFCAGKNRDGIPSTNLVPTPTILTTPVLQTCGGVAMKEYKIDQCAPMMLVRTTDQFASWTLWGIDSGICSVKRGVHFWR